MTVENRRHVGAPVSDLVGIGIRMRRGDVDLAVGAHYVSGKADSTPTPGFVPALRRIWGSGPLYAFELLKVLVEARVPCQSCGNVLVGQSPAFASIRTGGACPREMYPAP